MTKEVIAQDIKVGPIDVDTGNDWQDLGFVVVIIAVLVAARILLKKFGD